MRTAKVVGTADRGGGERAAEAAVAAWGTETDSERVRVRAEAEKAEEKTVEARAMAA
jgi:hypothetical protein